MFHLAAFWENIDPAGALANVAAALGEQVLFINGDDIRVPDDLTQVVAAAAVVGQTTTVGARVSSPSLRRFVNLDISPLNDGTDGDCLPTSPHAVQDLRGNPIQLDPGESLNAEIDSNQTDADDQSVIVWIADGPIQPVAGVPVHTVRCTGAITAVIGTWTNGQLTFGQDLPSGTYQVIGMRAQGTTLVAARLVFRGGSARPGVLGSTDANDLEWPHFRRGGMGVFGEFETNTPPTLDVLCNDADTAQVIHLDLVKLS